MLNNAYNDLKIARFRKLPKSVLLNQYWDIIAQPVFKAEYRELKFSNVFERESYKKNQIKRATYKKKQEKKKNCFYETA